MFPCHGTPVRAPGTRPSHQRGEGGLDQVMWPRPHVLSVLGFRQRGHEDTRAGLQTAARGACTSPGGRDTATAGHQPQDLLSRFWGSARGPGVIGLVPQVVRGTRPGPRSGGRGILGLQTHPLSAPPSHDTHPCARLRPVPPLPGPPSRGMRVSSPCATSCSPVRSHSRLLRPGLRQRDLRGTCRPPDFRGREAGTPGGAE